MDRGDQVLTALKRRRSQRPSSCGVGGSQSHEQRFADLSAMHARSRIVGAEDGGERHALEATRTAAPIGQQSATNRTARGRSARCAESAMAGNRSLACGRRLAPEPPRRVECTHDPRAEGQRSVDRRPLQRAQARCKREHVMEEDVTAGSIAVQDRSRSSSLSEPSASRQAQIAGSCSVAAARGRGAMNRGNVSRLGSKVDCSRSLD